MSVDKDVFTLNIAVDDLFLVHEHEPVHNLLHHVLELWLRKDDLLPLLKDALQVEFDKLEHQVDGLALAAHDVDKLYDIGMSLQLFEHLDFSERSDREPVLLVLDFNFLQRVDFVPDFGSVDFAECSFVDELLFFENFWRA